MNPIDIKDPEPQKINLLNDNERERALNSILEYIVDKSDNEQERCSARAFARVAMPFEAWLAAEVRNGTEPRALVHAGVYIITSMISRVAEMTAVPGREMNIINKMIHTALAVNQALHSRKKEIQQ